MTFGLPSMRIAGIVALMAAAMLAFAPSAADAHPGHSHARTTALAQPVADAVADPAASQPVKIQQVLSEFPGQPMPVSGDAGCDGNGCCTNGPCTGCHGFVLTSVLFELPPPSRALISAQDAQPPGGADVVRLRRPPRSFA